MVRDIDHVLDLLDLLTDSGLDSGREGEAGARAPLASPAEADIGGVALDPVELRYQPRFATDVATDRIEGPTIQVVPRTLAGLRPRTFALISGGVAVTAFAGLAAGWRWRSRRHQGTDDGGSNFDNLHTRYQEARNLRMQGDGAGSALLLVDLLAEMHEPSESDAAEHASLAEDLRFGGRVPAAGELDRLQREVGRWLEAQRPNPDETVRKALRLQDDEERS